MRVPPGAHTRSYSLPSRVWNCGQPISPCAGSSQNAHSCGLAGVTVSMREKYRHSSADPSRPRCSWKNAVPPGRYNRCSGIAPSRSSPTASTLTIPPPAGPTTLVPLASRKGEGSTGIVIPTRKRRRSLPEIPGAPATGRLRRRLSHSTTSSTPMGTFTKKMPLQDQ